VIGTGTSSGQSNSRKNAIPSAYLLSQQPTITLGRSHHDYTAIPTFNFLNTVASPELKGFFEHAEIMEAKPAEQIFIR